MASLTRSERIAVEIAADELQAYLEVVGEEGDLDEEELPTGKLRWALRKIRTMLEEEPATRQHGRRAGAAVSPERSTGTSRTSGNARPRRQS